MQWVEDLVAGKPSPSNDEPGIAYMMQGGWHWEKDGKITMDKNEPGAVRVKEPPHWMVFWPFGASRTYLPTMPGRFGAYIMWDSTPYAHLMIYTRTRSPLNRDVVLPNSGRPRGKVFPAGPSFFSPSDLKITLTFKAYTVYNISVLVRAFQAFRSIRTPF